VQLGAERLIAADKGEEKIAVEIKNFASSSAVSEFHPALTLTALLFNIFFHCFCTNIPSGTNKIIWCPQRRYF
jgi:hypothetical protein